MTKEKPKGDVEIEATKVITAIPLQKEKPLNSKVKLGKTGMPRLEWVYVRDVKEAVEKLKEALASNKPLTLNFCEVAIDSIFGSFE